VPVWADDDWQADMLLTRIQLLVEKTRSEQLRLEGDYLLREGKLRAECDSRIAVLQAEVDELRTGDSSVTTTVILPADTAAWDAERAAWQEERAILLAETARLHEEMERVQAETLPATVTSVPDTLPAELARLQGNIAAREEELAAARQEIANLQAELVTARENPLPAVTPETSLPDVFDADALDLNSATVEGLMTLEYVDQQLADYIVWYRTNIDWFASVEELRFVPGMTENRYRELKNRFFVSRPVE